MLNFTGKTAHFQEWYKGIEAFTPKSTYFKVDHETKEVLIARTFDRLCDQIPYFGEMHRRNIPKSQNEVAKITALVEEMNLHIQGREVFFRTNLFSPKDVQSPSMVSSGADALLMLLSSERLFRGYRELLKDDDLYLVFREKTDYQEEFRCFIGEGQVRGISQYEDSQSIRKGQGASRIFTYEERDYLRVLEYVEHVVGISRIQNAVLDVGITPTGMSVIELNPFSPSTDKSLFANSEIYSEPFTGKTDIRYWKDHQTLSVLEVEKGRVTARKEEWIPIPKQTSPSLNLSNLKSSLLDLRQDA